MCVMHVSKNVLGQSKREETGRHLIVQTKRVLVMYEYVNGDLRSLRLFKAGCNQINKQKLES